MTAIQKAREALVAAREALRADNMFTLSAKIDAALAALDAETEVKVRELEWGRSEKGGYLGGTIYVSETMVGTYFVEEYGEWCVYFNRELQSRGHSDEATAKSAAQADYERRIRSALVTPEARS